MNVQAYIESGILEMYALDQLDPNEREEVEGMISKFPEIRIEFENIQVTLEMYAMTRGIQPHPRVKEKIRNSISKLEKELDLDLRDLPLITDLSDYKKWLNLVNDLIPGEGVKDEMFTHVLHQSDKVVQMLVVTSTDIGEEVHDESLESFLILKGKCKCTVGNDVRFMEAGDFMTIPLNKNHNVEILSDQVVAILQHVAV